MADQKTFFATHGPALAALDAQPRARLTVADLDSELGTGIYRHRIGVYAIFEGERFLYVGICVTVPDGPETRTLYQESPKVLRSQPQARGLYGRLRTHAEGRPTDPLWVRYIEQRLTHQLTPDESSLFQRHELTLQSVLRRRIKDSRFQYRVVATTTPDEAGTIERGVRRYGLPIAKYPEFNRFSDRAMESSKVGSSRTG